MLISGSAGPHDNPSRKAAVAITGSGPTAPTPACPPRRRAPRAGRSLTDSDGEQATRSRTDRPASRRQARTRRSRVAGGIERGTEHSDHHDQRERQLTNRGRQRDRGHRNPASGADTNPGKELNAPENPANAGDPVTSRTNHGTVSMTTALPVPEARFAASNNTTGVRRSTSGIPTPLRTYADHGQRGAGRPVTGRPWPRPTTRPPRRVPIRSRSPLPTQHLCLSCLQGGFDAASQ